MKSFFFLSLPLFLSAFSYPPFDAGFNLQSGEKIVEGPLYDKSEQLYNDYIENIEIRSEYLIPKKIHLIWLGSRLPDKYKRHVEIWKKFHPNWDVRVWADGDIKEFQMTNYKAFTEATNYEQKSDIWRYEILYREGGLYVDTDFECLQSFDDLHRSLEFYTGLMRCGSVLCNGLIAARPNHPILKACIDHLQITPGQQNFSKILEEAGPYYFAKIFLKEVDSCPCRTAVAFPPIFFYAYPNTYRRILDDIALDFAGPESMAIHYWDTSWQK